MRRRLLLALAVALLPLAGPLPAQTGPWTDPSPHRVRIVPVAPEVSLEVLDWGGAGPPLVFLAGLGNSAHVFDDFALRFRDRFHVYAVTRRGFGASSRPADGYDAATRARDVVTVLDSLGIDRAVLAGHSIAGDELSRLGSAHPARVRALVFLDAYDYGPTFVALDEASPIPPQARGQPMTEADKASFATVAAYIERMLGVAQPEAELRADFVFGADGRLIGEAPNPGGSPNAAIITGTERGAYAEIGAPALAIYAVPRTAAEIFRNYASFDAENRALAERFHISSQRWADGVRARFRDEVANGTVILMPGAHHYLFISHPDEVERAIRDFLADRTR